MKKIIVGIFVYTWVIFMIVFAIGCPIAAIGYALSGDAMACIISLILCIIGIGGYTYLVTTETNANK